MFHRCSKVDRDQGQVTDSAGSGHKQGGYQIQLGEGGDDISKDPVDRQHRNNQDDRWNKHRFKGSNVTAGKAAPDNQTAENLHHHPKVHRIVDGSTNGAIKEKACEHRSDKSSCRKTQALNKNTPRTPGDVQR